MKYTKTSLLLCLALLACAKPQRIDVADLYPPYKVLVTFSDRIKPQTGLVLSGYGVNWGLPKGYVFKNGIGNIAVGYSLPKTQKDTVALKDARVLAISLIESLLQEVNSNQSIMNELDVYPFTSDRIEVSIHFEDENRVDLGTGVAYIYFANGMIEYERFDIEEYTGKYPALGKSSIILKESYAQALEIVQQEGVLTHF